MPRYFFDTDDGRWQLDDLAGHELADDEAARRLAREVLPEMASDRLPDGECCAFSVRVRNEAGAVVYSADLTFRGRWSASFRS